MKETKTKWYQYTSQFSEKVCTANDACIENQCSCTNYVKHFYRHVHKFNFNARHVLHIIGISIVLSMNLGNVLGRKINFSFVFYNWVISPVSFLWLALVVVHWIWANQSHASPVHICTTFKCMYVNTDFLAWVENSWLQLLHCSLLSTCEMNLTADKYCYFWQHWIISHAAVVRANRESKHNHSTFSTHIRAKVLLNAME